MRHCFYLTADSDAEGDNEDGDCQFMKDSDAAKDMPEDVLEEQRLDEDRLHPQHVQDVQHGDRDDHSRNKCFQLMPLPEKVKNT